MEKECDQEASGRSESDSWTSGGLGGRGHAACSHGCGGGTHDGRWTSTGSSWSTVRPASAQASPRRMPLRSERQIHSRSASVSSTRGSPSSARARSVSTSREERRALTGCPLLLGRMRGDFHGNNGGHGLPAFGEHGAREAHACDRLVDLGVRHPEERLELWSSPATGEGAPDALVLGVSQIRKRSTGLNHASAQGVHLFPRASAWSTWQMRHRPGRLRD